VVADPLSVQEAVTAQLTQAQAEFYRRDLREFVAAAWPIVEPKQFKSNWHLDAICDHLAYVTFGDIRNLMINIPPRQTKSLTASVLWPVWEWLLDPGVQFLFASYAQELAIRDAVKSRRLIESAWLRNDIQAPSTWIPQTTGRIATSTIMVAIASPARSWVRRQVKVATRSASTIRTT